MGKFSPMERSPRRESRKVIVVLEGVGERVAKKVRRRWKGWAGDVIV